MHQPLRLFVVCTLGTLACGGFWIEPVQAEVPAAESPAIHPADSSWLTHDGHIKRDPLFWPGTDLLAFTTEDPVTGVMRLVTLNLRTGNVAPLLEGHPDSTREFSVSADGHVYAYNTVSGLSSVVKVVDRRTDRQITLPRMGEANWANWASVSPDGTRVWFVEGAHSIYEYDLVQNQGRSSVRKVSQNAEHQSDYWPRFAPSGDEVVFVSNRSGDFEIYVMATSGGQLRQLTDSPGIDIHPCYSPDGQRIAFTSNRDGNFEIYVVSAAGGMPRRITNNPERDDFPAWHPAGKQLVVVSEQEGRFDLRLIECPDS